MKNSTRLLNYPELMAEIHRLSAKKQTGTIFITTNDNHLVRLVLNEGQIIHLVYDTTHRSYDAIPLIKSIQAGRLQFAAGIFEAADEVPLPPTKELLYTLSDEESPFVTSSSQPKQVSSSFVGAVTHIRQALSAHIGPIAAIICEEYIENRGGIHNLNDVKAMIENVAQEIGDANTEHIFKTQLKNEMIKDGFI